jgi:hypothetical protein
MALIFLAAMATSRCPFGLYCFSIRRPCGPWPGSWPTPDGCTELRAMSGGLPSAIGVLVLLATVRPGLVRPAVTTLAFLLPGLAAARLLGLALDGSWSAYTASGLAFEIAGSVLALALVRRA